MDEKKLKRIVSAATVTAVLLLLILMFVLVFQIVSLNKERKELAEWEEKVEYLRSMNEDERNSIEYRNTEEWVIRRARELGYAFPEDLNL